VTAYLRTSVGIADAEFVDALRVIRSELGLHAAQLVTFMCDGVAARITDAEFVDALRVEICLSRKRVLALCRQHPVQRRKTDGIVTRLNC